MGADFVARSGLGDELNYVPVDRHTFRSTAHDNIFAIGDASNIPTSKAGSVAHFSVEIFAANFCQHVAGRPMTGATATLRRVSTVAGIPIKELFGLFPGKPAKKMAYIAGLPKPHGCV